jgi:hypothetical protein
MSNYSLRNRKYLKLFGYGTFSVINNEVHVTAFDLSCLIFNVVVGFLAFYLSLRIGLSRVDQDSILVSLGVIITMNAASFVSITSMIVVFYQRHKIWKFIIILDGVIEKFRKIQVFPDFKRYVIIYGIFAILSLVMILLGVLMMAIFLGYSDKVPLLLIYGYLSATFSMSMAWTTMFHLAIFLRLRLMNQTIR